MLPRALPESVRRQVARRAFSTSHARIEFHPWKELLRLAGRESIDAVCFDLDAHVAAKCSQSGTNLRGVYCYEDIARDTFRVAHERGWTKFYDLPIAYWDRASGCFARKRERWPAWGTTLVGTADSAKSWNAKPRSWNSLMSFSAPSQFVLDSLPDDARLNKTCVVAEFDHRR